MTEQTIIDNYIRLCNKVVDSYFMYLDSSNTRYFGSARERIEDYTEIQEMFKTGQNEVYFQFTERMNEYYFLKTIFEEKDFRSASKKFKNIKFKKLEGK